jgi:hypothetical protein
MAATALNSTTLSEAVFVGQDPSVSFTVGSTANITVGSLLVAAGSGGMEVMNVQEIPISGRVNVLRGVGGTQARKHPSGTLVWIGTPELFKQVRDDAAGIVGDSNGLPEYLIPGSRARDGAGNEYVMVDLTMTAVLGATVLISKDGLFTASIITSTSVGSVGVLAEGGTSTQWAWAQIYGFVAHAKLVGGSSLVSSLGEFGGASSVSTPSVGLLGRSSSQRSSDYLVASTINAMFPASAASTASTSASSETGLFCSAWLQYPYIERAITS